MIRFGRPVTVDVEGRLPALVDALAADPAIMAVWLFGSRARDEADALSDVDVAVLAAPELDAAALWDRQVDWIATAAQALGTDEVGIQAVNRLPVALRQSVLRDARLLWARVPEIAADFVARTTKEYLDLKPFLDRYDRELLQQAATGRLR
jgi:uncharacterized protein